MSIFPHGDVPAVEVVPVGDLPDVIVRGVARTVEETIEVAPTIRDPISPPEDADLESFRDAAAYQRAVGEASDADHVVGITDDDLAWHRYDSDAEEYVVDDEIFGLGEVGGSVAVVSLPKLVDDDPPRERIPGRVRKVTRRFVGMLFGYQDCTDCVNEASPDLAALDEKPEDFCEDCGRRLRDPETAPEPDDWHVRTGELEEFQRLMEGDYHLWEYPLVALGRILVALDPVRRRLPSLPSLPRPARAAVHESYRVARFWVLVIAFLGSVVAVAAGLYGVHESFVGSEPSDVAAWGILAASLLLGWILLEVLRAVFGGVLLGLYLGFTGQSGPEE